jgi:PleD family two-component response regulator
MAPRHPGIEALLADADAALYQAKAAGRNTVQAYASAAGRPHNHIPTPP